MENVGKHHAYVVFANSVGESALPVAYKTASNDVYHLIVPKLTIDDVRELTRLAQQRPLEADAHVFVIVTNDILIEAQNALLKLFEEPPRHAQFFLVISPVSFLLPTLRSRLMEFDGGVGGERGTNTDTVFTNFLSAPYAQRLAEIVEHTKEKDAVWIESILQGCEVWTAEKPIERQDVLKSLLMVRSYIRTNGASAKMLLEDIALTLPVK
jgi:DNA polymerase III delta prime subunit